MIRIFTLEGCPYCKWLLNELDNSRIVYTNTDITNNDPLATSLEDMLNTTIYPIVHIVKSSVNIFLIAEGNEDSYTNDSQVIYVYDDIPHLVQLIKQNL